MKSFRTSFSAILLFCSIVFNYVPVRGGSQPPPEVLIPVPHHWQYTGYNCGPACMEMVFDYYGPDINQLEIGDVARTEPAPYGTYNTDMERAAHFSNLSTSVGSQLPENITGYTARSLGYAAFSAVSHFLDMGNLKTVLAEGYPIIMLWDWHYRVCVGYDSTYFFFQNSLMEELEKLTYQDFLSCWSSNANYSLFISPWQIEVLAPRNVSPGNFTVTATITYPCPSPFLQSQYPSHNATATVILPEGLSLAPTESAKKMIGTGDFIPTQNATITWNVQASTIGHYDIMVEADGTIEGFAPPIPSGYPAYTYKDRIGGEGDVIVAVTNTLDTTPPTTSDDYDGLWHNQSFMINLSADDDNSGVMETYYRVNYNPTKTIDTSGLPTIDTESVNNTLEYWSVDWAGNEEQHHILLNIKLDMATPITNDDYDGLWHTSDITVFLIASDNFALNQTYYRVNGGPIKTIIDDGEPVITVEGINNTLEYWSMDYAGNQEEHHILTGIELDKTAPTGSTIINNGDVYTTSTSATLTLAAIDVTSGVYQVRFSNDNVTWSNWEAYTTSKTWTLLTEDGVKVVIVQYRDNAGLISETCFDTIILDATAPVIDIPSRDPANNVQPDQSVKISVNITDTLSKVKNATLLYTINNGTSWTSSPMNYNLSTSLYETTILGQPAGTWVRFKIVAYDNAQNNATRDGVNQYCIYQVLPEFPSLLILSLFMIATLLAVIIHKRKHSR